MIDIHSHILNEIDDGSKSLEESVLMLEKARNDGITDIFCTPHYMRAGKYYPDKEVTAERFSNLKEIAREQFGINLYLGNEVMLKNYKLMDYIENDLVFTLNKSRYLLFEFPFAEFSRDIHDEVYDVCASGYRPILAHPERYLYIQKHPNIVFDLVREGCLMQVNQDSLFGRWGKEARETAILLLKHKLVHFIASDGHSTVRPVALKESYDYVLNYVSDDYRDDLYHNNGRKVINNENIRRYDDSKIEDVKYFWGLFTRKR